MNIDGLGELVPDKDIEEWLVSEPVAVSYFDGLPLRFIFQGLDADTNPRDFTKAFAGFMKLTPKDRNAAAPYVYSNYHEFVEAVTPDDIACEITSAEGVWEHVRPTEIFISRRCLDGKIYVQITAECEWEQEHGLQIVYREGNTLSRVSDQDGHLTHTDAYALPESEDRIC